MEQNNQHLQDSYETGSTKPPKERRAIVAALLMAVIFLGGISSALGLMNVRLFRQLKAKEQAVMSFSAGHGSDGASHSHLIPKDGAGLSPNARALLPVEGATVDSFYQKYYHVPAGFLISELPESCAAAQAGLLPGDVILSFNGQKTDTAGELTQAVLACQAGEEVTVTVYRNSTGANLRLCFRLEDAD